MFPIEEEMVYLSSSVLNEISPQTNNGDIEQLMSYQMNVQSDHPLTEREKKLVKAGGKIQAHPEICRGQRSMGTRVAEILGFIEDKEKKTSKQPCKPKNLEEIQKLLDFVSTINDEELAEDKIEDVLKSIENPKVYYTFTMMGSVMQQLKPVSKKIQNILNALNETKVVIEENRSSAIKYSIVHPLELPQMYASDRDPVKMKEYIEFFVKRMGGPISEKLQKMIKELESDPKPQDRASAKTSEAIESDPQPKDLLVMVEKLKKNESIVIPKYLTDAVENFLRSSENAAKRSKPKKPKKSDNSPSPEEKRDELEPETSPRVLQGPPSGSSKPKGSKKGDALPSPKDKRGELEPETSPQVLQDPPSGSSKPKGSEKGDALPSQEKKSGVLVSQPMSRGLQRLASDVEAVSTKKRSLDPDTVESDSDESFSGRHQGSGKKLAQKPKHKRGGIPFSLIQSGNFSDTDDDECGESKKNEKSTGKDRGRKGKRRS